MCRRRDSITFGHSAIICRREVFVAEALFTSEIINGPCDTPIATEPISVSIEASISGQKNRLRGVLYDFDNDTISLQPNIPAEFPIYLYVESLATNLYNDGEYKDPVNALNGIRILFQWSSEIRSGKFTLKIDCSGRHIPGLDICGGEREILDTSCDYFLCPDIASPGWASCKKFPQGSYAGRTTKSGIPVPDDIWRRIYGEPNFPVPGDPVIYTGRCDPECNPCEEDEPCEGTSLCNDATKCEDSQ